MVAKSTILSSMQFDYIHDKNPINTTGSAAVTITYQYAGTEEPDDLPTSTVFDGWTAFTTAEKTTFRGVLDEIENLLNVTFVEVTGEDDPDLNVGKVTIPGTTIGLGGNAISFFGDDIDTWDGFVVYDNTLDLSLEEQQSLLFHELGHALGLKHPFSDPTLPAAQENNKFTVMSYDDNPDTGLRGDAFMLYDVFALQDIWGAAPNNGGNTVYTGPRNDTVDVIWDSGGRDALKANAGDGAVRLDLREGKFSEFGSYDDVVIAYGTKIENAFGGGGNDRLIGNALRNKLVGKGGEDVILGKKGNDVMKGGGGDDTLKGGPGRDRIDGQKGNDTLIGNGGNDTFIFRKGGGDDRIKGFVDDADTLKIVGHGSKSEVLDMASNVGGNVVFDFDNGDSLTVLNMTKSEITDDLIV